VSVTCIRSVDSAINFQIPLWDNPLLDLHLTNSTRLRYDSSFLSTYCQLIYLLMTRMTIMPVTIILLQHAYFVQQVFKTGRPLLHQLIYWRHVPDNIQFHKHWELTNKRNFCALIISPAKCTVHHTGGNVSVETTAVSISALADTACMFYTNQIYTNLGWKLDKRAAEPRVVDIWRRLCPMQRCNTLNPVFKYFCIMLYGLHNLLTQIFCKLYILFCFIPYLIFQI